MLKNENENIPLIFIRNVPGSIPTLKNASVGIAGAGGLGSNAAVMLARSGIGHLTVVDFDIVAPENLNRQHFFDDQLGKTKVDALGETIRKINPYIDYVPLCTRLTPANIPAVFSDVDALIEAFDNADQKAMLIDTWINLHNGKLLVAASGLAGYGKIEKIKINRMGTLVIVGDLESKLTEGLMAPRVIMVAAMQANIVIEYLLERK